MEGLLSTGPTGSSFQGKIKTVKPIMALKDITTQNSEPTQKNHKRNVKERLI